MLNGNRSIEGAYDEAIEDAASRIYEASRPQRILTSRSLSKRIAGVVSSADIINVDKGNSEVLSSPSDYTDNESDEMSTFGDGNSSDDDIENNILYLEEKKKILKKAKIRKEKEEAYIAVNAYDIVNGREPSSRRLGSSSIWSEAKAMIEEYRMVGMEGSRCEEDDYSPTGLMISHLVCDSGRPENTSSQSAPDIRLSPSLLFPTPDSIIHPRRKRRKIDLSSVKNISSTEFAKEFTSPKIGISEDRGEITCINEKSPIYYTHFSPTARCQQAREMQLAIDSRNWISQAVVNQILALTNAAISKHRRSNIATGKGE